MEIRFSREAAKFLAKLSPQEAEKIREKLAYLLKSLETEAVIPFNELDTKNLKGDWSKYPASYHLGNYSSLNRTVSDHFTNVDTLRVALAAFGYFRKICLLFRFVETSNLQVTCKKLCCWQLALTMRCTDASQDDR